MVRAATTTEVRIWCSLEAGGCHFQTSGRPIYGLGILQIASAMIRNYAEIRSSQAGVQAGQNIVAYAMEVLPEEVPLVVLVPDKPACRPDFVLYLEGLSVMVEPAPTLVAQEHALATICCVARAFASSRRAGFCEEWSLLRSFLVMMCNGLDGSNA